jgi:cellulose synthase (UDP-forming)
MFDPFFAPTFIPLLLTIALPLFVTALFGRTSGVTRLIIVSAVVVCSLRYMWWRWTMSMPRSQEAWQDAWAWIVLAFESLTILGTTIDHLFLSRTRSRSADVDARAGSPLLNAPVDVFIATYNEEYEILERTILGATSIDHPDLRVWVLDDGARPWVRELAESMGAYYRYRVKGQHAKAGNINNGLREALATGRQPDFILMLDADFVAFRNILKRTLPLFDERDVGIVQTPQHFFNPDPIQVNLFCASFFPDEQRFFFNHLQPAKDAWGAAFCCGTSAVVRVAALIACGGVPTATVTEDMLTTFRMREFAYRTVFLNERLSLGLSPEGLTEYISQRTRWCLGAVQQIRTRWSFAGPAKIGLINRLSSLDGALYWIASFVCRLMMISAPMIYWWTGTAVLEGSTDDIVAWLLPYVVSGIIFTSVIAENTMLPIITDVTHMLIAPWIVRTVAIGLVRPWGHPFKVTPKGVVRERLTIHWRFLAPFAFIAVATMAGMLVNLSPYSPLSGTPGYSINMVWSLLNIFLLTIACAVCVELPKAREERFASHERANLMLHGEPGTMCIVHEISVSEAKITISGEPRSVGAAGLISLEAGQLPLRFVTASVSRTGEIIIRFDHDNASRRALTRYLFTGAHHNDIARVRVFSALRSAALRVLY